MLADVRVNARTGGHTAQRTGVVPFTAVSFQPQPDDQGERVLDLRPVCPWCCERYERVRGNQIFCTRRHSQEACERRKAEAVKISYELFQPFGLSVEHLRDIAEACWNRLRALIESYGFRYDEYAKRWAFSVDVVVAHLKQ